MGRYLAYGKEILEPEDYLQLKQEADALKKIHASLDLIGNRHDEVVDAIYQGVRTFESGDRANRHNNPGAIIYTDELAEEFGATQGDSFIGEDLEGNPIELHTAYFQNPQEGAAATKFIINKKVNQLHANNEFIGNTRGKYSYGEAFASLYTGSQDPEVLANYGSEIEKEIGNIRVGEKQYARQTHEYDKKTGKYTTRELPLEYYNPDAPDKFKDPREKTDKYKSPVELATGEKSDIVSKFDLVHKYRHYNPGAYSLSDQEVWRRVVKMMPEEVARLKDPTWTQSFNASWEQTWNNFDKSLPQIARIAAEPTFDTVSQIVLFAKEFINLALGSEDGDPHEDFAYSEKWWDTREPLNMILGKDFDKNFDYRKAYVEGSDDPRLFEMRKAFPENDSISSYVSDVALMSEENRDLVFQQIAKNEVLDERNEKIRERLTPEPKIYIDGQGNKKDLTPKVEYPAYDSSPFNEEEVIRFNELLERMHRETGGFPGLLADLEDWERSNSKKVDQNWQRAIKNNPDILASLMWSEGELLTEGDYSKEKIMGLLGGVLPSQFWTQGLGYLGAAIGIIATKGKSLIKGNPAKLGKYFKSGSTGFVWGSTVGGFIMEGSAHYEEGMNYLTQDNEISKGQFLSESEQLKEGLKDDYFSDSDTYYDYGTNNTYTLESLYRKQMEDLYFTKDGKYYAKAMSNRDAADAVAYASLGHGTVAAILENIESRIFTTVASGSRHVTKNLIDKKGLGFFAKQLDKYNAFGRRIIRDNKGSGIFSNKLINKIGFNTSKLGIMMTAEGTEEVLQGMSNEAWAAWTWGRDPYHRTWEDVHTEFVGGALGALALGGGAVMSSSIQSMQRISNLKEKYMAKYGEGDFTTIEDNGDGTFSIYKTHNSRKVLTSEEKIKLETELAEMEKLEKKSDSISRLEFKIGDTRHSFKNKQDLKDSIKELKENLKNNGVLKTEKYILEDEKGSGYVTNPNTGEKIPTRYNNFRDAFEASQIFTKAYKDIDKMLTVWDMKEALGGTTDITKEEKDGKTTYKYVVKSKDGNVIFSKNYDKSNDAINARNQTKNHLEELLDWEKEFGGIDAIEKSEIVQNAEENRKAFKEDIKDQKDFKKDYGVKSGVTLQGEEISREVIGLDHFMGVNVNKKYGTTPELDQIITEWDEQGVTENPDIIADMLEENPEIWDNVPYTPEQFFDVIEERFADQEGYAAARIRIEDSLDEQIYDKSTSDFDRGIADTVAQDVDVVPEDKPVEGEVAPEDEVTTPEEIAALTGIDEKEQQILQEKRKVGEAKEELDTAVKEAVEKEKKTIEVGEKTTLYNEIGRPVEVEVTAKQGEDTFKYNDPNSKEEILYTGQELSKQDPKSENFKLETIKDSPKVSDMTTGQLKTLLTRKQKMAENTKGNKTQPNVWKLHAREAKAIELELARRRSEKLDKAVDKKPGQPLTKDEGAVSRDFADPRFTDLKYYGAIHMRQIVSVKVDGKDAIFYRSSAGTAGDYAGKWMPILGLTDKDWFIKHVVKGVNTYEEALAYYPIDIQDAAKALTEKYPEQLIIDEFGKRQSKKEVGNLSLMLDAPKGFKPASHHPIYGKKDRLPPHSGDPIAAMMDVYTEKQDNLWAEIDPEVWKKYTERFEGAPREMHTRPGGELKKPGFNLQEAPIKAVNEGEQLGHKRGYKEYKIISRKDEIKIVSGKPVKLKNTNREMFVSRTSDNFYSITDARSGMVIPVRFKMETIEKAIFAAEQIIDEKIKEGTWKDIILNVEKLMSKKVFEREKRTLRDSLPNVSELTDKKDIIKARLDALKSTFNNKIKYELVTTENAPKGRENEIAWIKGNTVYVNTDFMDVTAPFHEFSHPFILDLRLENKALFDSIIKSIKNNDKKLWNTVKDKYSDSSLIVQEEELLAHALEKIAKVEYEKGSKGSKIVNAIKKMFNWLRVKFFGTSKKDLYANSLDENTTIEELAEMIMNQEDRYRIILSDKTLETLEIGEDKLIESKNQEKYGYTVLFERSLAGYTNQIAEVQSQIDAIPKAEFRTEEGDLTPKAEELTNKINNLEKLKKDVEWKLDEEGLRQQEIAAESIYEITVNDREKFEKVPFERFKKKLDSEINKKTIPITMKQVHQKVIDQMEIDDLNVRSASKIQLDSIFDQAWTDMRIIARRQNPVNVPPALLVDPIAFGAEMLDGLPMWAMKSFESWWSGKFSELAQNPELTKQYNPEDYFFSEEDIHNEVINFVNETDFLNQDFAYKMATNEEVASKNDLTIMNALKMVVSDPQMSTIYVRAKQYWNNVEHLIGENIPNKEDRFEAWLKDILKDVLKKRYTTLTDWQKSDMLKTYNRINNSRRTNGPLVTPENPDTHKGLILNNQVGQGNEINNIEIKLKEEWYKNSKGESRKGFNLIPNDLAKNTPNGVGTFIITVKSQVNPETGKSNISKEKTTLAQYHKVNTTTPIYWLNADDMFDQKDKRRKNKEGKWETVKIKSGPDEGKAVQVFTNTYNGLSGFYLMQLSIGLRRNSMAISFSRSDSNKVGIIQVADYHKNLAKNPMKFWNQQIDAGFIKPILNADGTIKTSAESRVANLIKGDLFMKAREIAVFLATNEVYPGYLNDPKGGANVYNRLKIPFTPVTVSQSMPAIRVDKFNPREVLFRGALTDIKIDGQPARTFASHSPWKDKGLPEATYIGDGKSITSQDMFDLFETHHGLRPTTAKAKTVIYYKSKNKSLMFKHQHILPTRSWEITDLDGNLLYTIDNKRRIFDADGNPVHMLVTDDELKVGGTEDGLMSIKNNSMEIAGDSVGFIKYDEHSKDNVKHSAQIYNHIYDDKVIDAFFEKYLPTLKTELRQSYLLGVSSAEEIKNNPQAQAERIFRFIKESSGRDAPSFAPHALELARLGGGLFMGMTPMTDVLMMSKKIMPAIEFSKSNGSIFDIDMDEAGELAEGEIGLGVQNSKMIKILYANSQPKPMSTSEEALKKISISDINDWLQQRIDEGNPIKVLVTRYPASHIGSSGMLTVKKLHSRRSIATMNYIDVKGRFEGDNDGDEVHVELLGDNSESDTVTQAWVDMFDAVDIKGINLNDFTEGIKTQFDLTKITDRIKLITAFNAGARAIGEIANVQSVYNTMYNTIENFEVTIVLEDESGKPKRETFKIKPRSPKDIVTFHRATYEGEKGAWKGPFDEYLRIWLQAAVDNSKFLLLDNWEYGQEMTEMTGQARLMSKMFVLAEDTSFGKQGDEITPNIYLNVAPMVKRMKWNGRLRDGRDNDYKKLGTADFLEKSSEQNQFVNTRDTWLEDIQKESAAAKLKESMGQEVEVWPIKANLKDTKHKTENGKPVTVLESIVTAAQQMYEEMSVGRGLTGYRHSPIMITTRLHEKGHMDAMSGITNKMTALLNGAATKDGMTDNQDYIDKEISRGEDYAFGMGGEFWKIMDGIYSVGIQTQDRHILLQDHIKAWEPTYKTLSNVAKLAATQKFMSGFPTAGLGLDRHYTSVAPNVIPAVSKKSTEPTLLDPGWFETHYFPVYNQTVNENRNERLMQEKPHKFPYYSEIFKRGC